MKYNRRVAFRSIAAVLAAFCEIAMPPSHLDFAEITPKSPPSMQSPRFLIAMVPFLFGMLAEPVFAQFGAPELQALQQLGCKVGQGLPPSTGAVGQGLLNTISILGNQAPGAETVPATYGSGLYQLRAFGPNGLSNSRSFMVTEEPWVLVAGNESEVNPTVIAPGTIWQDECPDRGRNYYRLKFEVDRKLELQSFALALDSRARLVMSLLNPEHVTIATVSATNDRDASLTLDLKANTEYSLMVHDHIFRGGGEYRYALKLVDVVATEKTPAELESIVDRWRAVALPKSSDARSQKYPVLWHPRSAMLRAPTDAPVVVHDESLFEGTKPMMVAWPTIVAGQWNTNDDIDHFDFECEAKTDVSVELVSQRVGELSDGQIVAFRLENAGQPNEVMHRLVENDDGPGVGNGEMRLGIKDPQLTFQTPDKGIYRLQVRSQQRLDRHSGAPKYALEIRKPNPGFALGAHMATPVRDLEQSRSTSPTLCAGGSLMVSVHALRFDNFADPIELNVNGLTDGFRGGSGVIARDQNLATLNIWSFGPETKERKEIANLEIKGTTEIGFKSLSAIATPLEVTWNSIDTFRSPISKTTDALKIVKTEATICPLTVELGPKDTDAKSPIRMDVIRGQPLNIPIRVTRRTGGEVAVTVRLRHNPAKTTAAEIKLEPKVDEGTLELQVPKDAPLGEFMLGALCEAAVTIPNTDPMAKEKTKGITLQLPTSNLRIRIGDAP
jgi:hypothetical protein